MQPLWETDCVMATPAEPIERQIRLSLRLKLTTWRRDTKGILMNAFTRYTDVTTCCAFCSKLLPIVNGEVVPWRASNGQFFCNEFCADDAEEMRFQSRGRTGRIAYDRITLESIR